ncbi:MAG: hypothetical protein ACYSWQ_06775 [Planctomycetota bacterium]|jgi:hypothetical protein
MKTPNVSARKIVLVMVFIAVIGAYVLLILDSPDDSPQQRRVRLLHHTDHEALLKAGREILSNGPDPKKYRPFGPIHIDGFPVPRGVPIPRVIRKLRPHAVLINLNGYLVLHMTEGIENYGVKIYPGGFTPPGERFRYGHRELLKQANGPNLTKQIPVTHTRNPERARFPRVVVQSKANRRALPGNPKREVRNPK